jgi:hypothetical protein
VAVLNTRHCGDWSGLAPEGVGARKRPQFLAPVETLLIGMQNLAPPIFPFTKQWHNYLERTMPRGLAEQLDKAMESGPAVATFNLPELQTEENAGVGFGVSVLLIVSAAAGTFRNRRARMKSLPSIWQISIQLAPYASLLALVANSNLVAIGRIIAPYYVLSMPILLVNAAHERLSRQSWWRIAAFTVFVIAAILMTASPARPLFPVEAFLKKTDTGATSSTSSRRVGEVYAVYRDRWDAFAPVRESLPANLKVLGFVTYDDPEASLWRPFGTRRVEHVRPEDIAVNLKARDIEYVLARTDVFESRFACSAEDWIRRANAEVIRRFQLNLRASTGPRDWYLLRLPGNP